MRYGNGMNRMTIERKINNKFFFGVFCVRKKRKKLSIVSKWTSFIVFCVKRRSLLNQIILLYGLIFRHKTQWKQIVREWMEINNKNEIFVLFHISTIFTTPYKAISVAVKDPKVTLLWLNLLHKESFHCFTFLAGWLSS